MISTKPIFDLIGKMSRNNKDRMLGNDLLELLRIMKGFDKTLQDLFNNKIASGLEIDRLKQEIKKLKNGPAATGSFSSPSPPAAAPAQPKPEPPPRVSFEGVVWHSGGDQKK